MDKNQMKKYNIKKLARKEDKRSYESWIDLMLILWQKI